LAPCDGCVPVATSGTVRGRRSESVLILAEGPVLPYGAVLRQNLIATLRRDGAEPLNIYEELIVRIRF
jgi:hypothetical protein